ncbi:hypothetical protein AURDEDRAFT_163260 [Auricularia subglabra TFB-10046 SS5]|nr:hypothetical protein AURDEDRAFT_163260 [Auricularia subglabra TFB-10046 SS5]
MDDPFGSLDDSAFDDAPIKSREDRMRAAFEESRRSYNPATELIIVDNRWYSSSAALHGLLAAKAALKTIDYEISWLYAQRDYAGVLELVQSELDKPETVDSKEYHRSLLDTALRCCLKISDIDSGLRFVDLSKDKWTGSPALALTSSKVLLTAGKARDAIFAVLTALEYNASLNPCLDVLHRALQDLGPHSQAAHHLADHLRSRMSKQRQRSDFPFLTQRPSKPDAGALSIAVDDDTLALWCQSCDFDDESTTRLQKLLFLKPADDEGAEGTARRSVKEL